MFKCGDRIKIVKPKLSWNGKNTLARVGQTGELLTDQLSEHETELYIWLDGHKKGMFIHPDCVQLI